MPLGGLISSLNTDKERISDLKDTSIETSKTDMQRENVIKKMEQNFQKMCDNYKRNNVCLIRLPKGGEREKRIEEIFEITMVNNFLKLMANTKP